MKRIFAKTISLMLILSIFMSIPAWAETEPTPEPTPKPLNIEQYQFERDAVGNFVSVEADKVRNIHLMPVVGDTTDKNDVEIVVDQFEIPAETFNDKLNGVVDNVIVVKNDSPADGANCYFRTVFAVESPDNGRDVVLNFNTDTSYVITKVQESVTINETEFDIYTAVYQNVLNIGEIAPPSLLQVYMPSETTSEEAALYGESFELMIVSQAIQAADELSLTTAMGQLGDAEKVFTENQTLLTKLRDLIASIFTNK